MTADFWVAVGTFPERVEQLECVAAAKSCLGLSHQTEGLPQVNTGEVVESRRAQVSDSLLWSKD